MKSWLYSLACFAMLYCAVSCGPKKVPDETKAEVEYYEIPSKFYLADTSILARELDTLSLADLDRTTRFEFNIDEGDPMTFCGKVNTATDTRGYKIKIHFKADGALVAHKMSMGRIRGGDKFMYSFTAPAKGTVQISIEEERKIVGVTNWKQMALKSVLTGPDCCPLPPDALTVRGGRINVTTTNNTGSGVTVKVEQ
jgi:hypothetical protein